MNNLLQAGHNVSGHNNKVDRRFDSGDKNVIGPNTQIHGNPIVGDNSGNNNNKVVGNNSVVGNNNNTKSNNTMNSNNKGGGNNSPISFG